MEFNRYLEKLNYCLLMFADNIAVLPSTLVGLQNQLNVLYELPTDWTCLLTLRRLK